MSTPWVVPAFDEVEDGEARVGLRAEAFAIEQLALERREEALAQGVVVGIAYTAHRRPDASLATAAAEGERRVLAALIRVMNHLGRSALRDGHVERGQDELGAKMRFHRPADDAAAPHRSAPASTAVASATRSTRWGRHPARGTWWRLDGRPGVRSRTRILGRDRIGLPCKPGRGF